MTSRRLSHHPAIASYCQLLPAHVRSILLSLERRQNVSRQVDDSTAGYDKSMLTASSAFFFLEIFLHVFNPQTHHQIPRPPPTYLHDILHIVAYHI